MSDADLSDDLAASVAVAVPFERRLAGSSRSRAAVASATATQTTIANAGHVAPKSNTGGGGNGVGTVGDDEIGGGGADGRG
jgi:hypothetical protein